MPKSKSPSKTKTKTAPAKPRQAAPVGRATAPAVSKQTSSAATAKVVRQQRASAQSSTTTKATAQPVMRVTHDDIARKAYEIWLAKGRPLGQDQQNWHEAEAELTQTQ